jgi:hypothetical protein
MENPFLESSSPSRKDLVPAKGTDMLGSAFYPLRCRSL